MASCSDAENKADSPCICCFPPDPVNTTVDPTPDMLKSRIYSKNECYLQQLILLIMLNDELNKDLYIKYIDSTNVQLSTLKTYTYIDTFTGNPEEKLLDLSQRNTKFV